MADESFQDKTEPATPKKKEDARKKGQVARSKELSSIAVLTAGVIYLYFSAKGLTFNLAEFIRETFSRIPSLCASDHKMLSLFIESVERFLYLILPIMIVLSVVALLANYLQTGIIWSVDPLTPKASKINPLSGLKRMVSKRSFVELAKSIFKILIVGWAAFSTLKSEFIHIMPLMQQEQIQIISLLADISFKVTVKCCWVIAILAILDYIYQKWEFTENLKMTKQEVKDENKQTEGDPLVKSRIRSIQREMARRRMMEEVPKADVVITNPTHLAVALRYDSKEKMSAPIIVAKGANKVAERIRNVAEAHHIPLVENKPLAQNLYKLDLGEEVPPQFYQAVAEILAYVYGLKKDR
ncbi:MAG: flagellar biosynthesis protein FlhB [Deltaproteobacteria bacterium]|nr:flagellar biosynthesis protein FlhB [Deltaproteobacteria bacterium]